MPRRHKRNPFSDEDRNYVDVKLVNFTGIEERGNQLAATHHPDLFARRRAQALRKRLHRLRHEIDASRRACRRLP